MYKLNASPPSNSLLLKTDVLGNSAVNLGDRGLTLGVNWG
jgi:hypothetical protein